MANASAPFPLQPQLADAFRTAVNEGVPSTRWISVKIVNETFVLVATGKQTANQSADFNSMARSTGVNNDDPMYFLFRLEGKSWLLVSYVPPNTKVKERMLNASAKSQLKAALGVQFFVDELHTNNQEELSWAFYQGALNPSTPYSASELEHHRVLAEEDAERASRAKPASGGYHTVALPLSAAAHEKIRQFTSGTLNFVELQVNATKDGVNAGAAEVIAEADLSKRIHTREPRFYLFKSGPSKTVFIFSCPDTAPPQLKMVYSSSKGSVADQTKVQFTKKIEIREPSEVNDSLRSSGSYTGGGGSPSLAAAMGVKGKAPPGVVGRAGGSWEGSTAPRAKEVTGIRADSSTPHPVYSLIAGATGSPPASPGAGRSTNRKTIVIPPKHAY